MFSRLGRLILRFRWLVVAVWLAAALAAAFLAPSLASVGSADETSFLPADAQSLQARELTQKAFPSDAAASTATLVLERGGGLTSADQTYLRDLGTWLTSPSAPAAVHDVVTGFVSVVQQPELASMFRSPDGAVELATVQFNTVSFQEKTNAAVDAIRAHVAATVPAGLRVSVTGQAGIGRDYMQALLDGTDRTTVVTIVLVVLILLLIYRAPLAALVPLLTIGAAYLVGRGVLGELGSAGWKLSSIMDSFVVVLVFGVGTDYTIFLISRFREELGRADVEAAIPLTVGRIGAVITASAATVIVGLGSMVVGRFGLIQSTGPGLALVIFITLLAGLTLTPALLSIFGHHLFWPLHEHRRAGNDERGFWAALARRITGHPAAAALAVLAVMLVPLAGLPAMRSNFDVLAELPTTSDARQGYEDLAQHLGKGQLLPVNVLVNVPGGNLSTPTALARLRATTDLLARTAGVQAVRSVVEPTGDGTVPATVRPSGELADLATQLTPSGDPAAARAALLKPDATTGLDSAVSYLDALGAAFPDEAVSAAFTAARGDLAALSQAIRQLQASARVNLQLRALSGALTSAAAAPAADPAAAAAQLRIVAGYLGELATSFPDVTGQPSFADARAVLVELQASPSAGLIGRLSTDLEALAVVFDSRPDALLLPTSLPATSASTALSARISQLSTAVPTELKSLAGPFAALPDDYFLPTSLSGSAGSSAKALLDAYVSPTGSVSRLYVTVKGDPYSTAAFDTVHRIRDAAATGRAAYGNTASILVGGPTAEFTDIQTTISEDFQRVAVITIGGILVVLVLLLRAIVAPIYLVLTVLLSYLATLGLSTLIFQRWLGQPGLNYFIPIIVFVLLVALGSDYNIFLMARVREESAAHGLRDGIRRASARTGTVITSAGIILAGTFGALGTAPLQMLVQVGVTVGLGVLIDTFLVRSILVPALTARIGEVAWWPFGRGVRPALAPAGPGGPAGSLEAAGGYELGPADLAARLDGRPATPDRREAVGPGSEGIGAATADRSRRPESPPATPPAAPTAAEWETLTAAGREDATAVVRAVPGEWPEMPAARPEPGSRLARRALVLGGLAVAAVAVRLMVGRRRSGGSGEG